MRFQGIIYRAHNPQWMWSPLSGAGAERHGGRFNRKGVAAFYASLSLTTAILEACPIGRPMQPLTLCAYDADVDAVFDALDPAQRQAQAVTDDELNCPNWEREMLNGAAPASHNLADRLIAAEYAGMRVRSFARNAGPDDVNLVFWRWGDRRPSRITLIDVEERLQPGR